LASGDKDAAALTDVCAVAGVTICRYPVPADKIKPGETLAAAMLQKVLGKYGREVLISALSCITQTRRGNPGMIRKQIVEALCAVLEADPDWLKDRNRLIFAIQTFDFAAQFKAVWAKSAERGESVVSCLIEAIGDHLDSKASVSAPADKPVAAPVVAPKEPPRKPAAGNGGLSIGRDEIAFNGQRIRVAPRAALLVAALAKAKPNCVGDDFLILRIWNHRPPNAGELLDQLVRDLGALKKLGLEVRTQRGIGRQLVEVTP
jgi:hypothetical protein